ncbi:MAG: hypothetical protein [Microviridae sp.]|nr:MAG: hypothetical protein [Microviridae sp.]
MASRFKQRGILGVLGSIGSFLSGSAGSIGGALAGSALSGAIGRSNQEDAQDFNREMYGSRYQMQMEDMRKAGLNPMLSYLQSPSSAPGSPIASVPDFGSTINQARQADASGVSSSASAQTAASYEAMANETVNKTKQEVSNLKSVNAQVLQITDNLRAEYQNLVKQGLNLTEVGNQLRKTVDKMDAEIKLIGSQTVSNAVQAVLFGAQANMATAQAGYTSGALTLQSLSQAQLNRAAAITQRSQDALNLANTGKSMTENELLKIEERAASSFGEVGKTVGALRPFLELLWNATKR